MYSAILLSGGKGKRMMKDVPKQYLLLAGKPIIMHSLEKLDHLAQIDEIVIVCEDEYQQSLQHMLKQYNIETYTKLAAAGATRQDSVYNGLCCIKNKKVIIHESARPFVTESDYLKLINTDSPNAMLGYPIPYTVVKGNNVITDILDRSELINVQLPQKFDVDILYKAHQKAKAEGKVFTEDASMVFFYTNSAVKVVDGSVYNLKITEPIDLLIGEVIYREYMTGRR